MVFRRLFRRENEHLARYPKDEAGEMKRSCRLPLGLTQRWRP